jgi:ABC-3C biological conflict system middle component
VGEVTQESLVHNPPVFNGPVEIGLRALCVLTAGYPSSYSMQQLVIFDYLMVHSDDMPGGPTGLHPRTPHRGGEILVRRGVLQDGLLLYHSRGLIQRVYQDGGVFFAAADHSAGFLDSLNAPYVLALRERAAWVAAAFGLLSDKDLESAVGGRIGTWGAEFELQSVLWAEHPL